MNNLKYIYQHNRRTEILFALSCVLILRCLSTPVLLPWDMLYVGAALSFVLSGIFINFSKPSSKLNVGFLFQLGLVEALVMIFWGMKPQFIFLCVLGSVLPAICAICNELHN